MSPGNQKRFEPMLTGLKICHGQAHEIRVPCKPSVMALNATVYYSSGEFPRKPSALNFIFRRATLTKKLSSMMKSSSVTCQHDA